MIGCDLVPVPILIGQVSYILTPPVPPCRHLAPAPVGPKIFKPARRAHNPVWRQCWWRRTCFCLLPLQRAILDDFRARSVPVIQRVTSQNFWGKKIVKLQYNQVNQKMAALPPDPEYTEVGIKVLKYRFTLRVHRRTPTPSMTSEDGASEATASADSRPARPSRPTRSRTNSTASSIGKSLF